MAKVSYNNELKLKYYLGIGIMLLFVTGDLVFDFLFSFEGSNSISFACTLCAAIIVFYGSYALKKKHITTEFEKATAFIKSNFDNWQVAFSILDIICGIISLLSGVAFLTAIFKVVKIGYIPLKITVVTNKSKSIVKAIAKVGLLWTGGRLLSECGENDNIKENDSMFKKIGNALKTAGQWIWANKLSLLGTLAAVASGVASAMVANADLIANFPSLVVFGIDIMPYAIGFVIFGFAEVGIVCRGYETISEYKENEAAIAEARKENQERKATIKAQAEDLKKAAKKLKELEDAERAKLSEAEIEQKKQAEEVKKAEEARKAEEAKKAEEERILALALELKAKKEAAEKENN